MSYLANGDTHHFVLPIQSISVNKNNVIVTDNAGLIRIQLNNGVETRGFLKWLYSLNS